jgi:hypothetical protein
LAQVHFSHLGIGKTIIRARVGLGQFSVNCATPEIANDGRRQRASNTKKNSKYVYHILGEVSQ